MRRLATNSACVVDTTVILDLVLQTRGFDRLKDLLKMALSQDVVFLQNRG